MSSTSKTIKDHPAFPVHPYLGDDYNPKVRGNSGMSMLDYFASAAVIGLSNLDLSPREIALTAYDIAHQLMMERQTR
jgi:hypothetical protein